MAVGRPVLKEWEPHSLKSKSRCNVYCVYLSSSILTITKTYIVCNAPHDCRFKSWSLWVWTPSVISSSDHKKLLIKTCRPLSTYLAQNVYRWTSYIQHKDSNPLRLKGESGASAKSKTRAQCTIHYPLLCLNDGLVQHEYPTPYSCFKCSNHSETYFLDVAAEFYVRL